MLFVDLDLQDIHYCRGVGGAGFRRNRECIAPGGPWFLDVLGILGIRI